MDFIFTEVKKLTVTLLVINCIIIAICLLGGFLDFAVWMGMLYGFVFAELMFILLGMLVSRACLMAQKQAKRYMQINYAVRFLLTGIILLIPFLSPKINGWCVVVAMLSPKFTYFSIGFFQTAKSMILKKKG